MSAARSAIKYPTGIVLISAIVACLFLVFRDSSDALLFLKFFVFPGVLFVFLGSLVIDWFDRKVFARMQNRVGPRFIQPVYDLLKLLAKEDITPNGVDTPEFDAIPAVQLGLAFLVAFTVPVYMVEGLISFDGDLIFILFILALLGASVFLLGWATNNPYGVIGGSRAAVAEFSFEIPLALALIGPAILAGSLQLSVILASDYTLVGLPLAISRGDEPLKAINVLYLIPLLVLFGIAILSATAILEKVPFDPAHAEVEIIGGWTVEISGKKLLFTRLANLILEFSLAGIIAAIFLGGPNYPTEIGIDGIWEIGDWDVLVYLFSITSFIIKMMIVVFLITSMRTLHSRLRIDQLVQFFWRYYLPIALAALFVIITFVGIDLETI
ncbi:MAG: complex I subunit 1 family protein [Candidatus Hodarchaeota archaeon]